MDEPVRRPIEDFASVLRAFGLRQDASSALVGGQAVNAWASVYRASMGAPLDEHLPFTSFDIDVAGSPDLLIALHRELGGIVRVAGPLQIAHGTLSIGEGAGAIELDVLRVVNGVKSIRPSDRIALELCGAVVPVLFPHILLRGKLANAAQLEQQGRQDVKHVKILSLVLEQFLRPVTDSCRLPGSSTTRCRTACRARRCGTGRGNPSGRGRRPPRQPILPQGKRERHDADRPGRRSRRRALRERAASTAFRGRFEIREPEIAHGPRRLPRQPVREPVAIAGYPNVCNARECAHARVGDFLPERP